MSATAKKTRLAIRWAVVALDGTKSGDLTGKELWQHLEIMAGKSSPVLLDGRLYVVDDRAKLFVFDAQTGKLITRKALGTVMRSTPLLADGKIYFCTNAGLWCIMKPTERRRRCPPLAAGRRRKRRLADRLAWPHLSADVRIHVLHGNAESAATGRSASAGAERRPRNR